MGNVFVPRRETRRRRLQDSQHATPALLPSSTYVHAKISQIAETRIVVIEMMPARPKEDDLLFHPPVASSYHNLSSLPQRIAKRCLHVSLFPHTGDKITRTPIEGLPIHNSAIS